MSVYVSTLIWKSSALKGTDLVMLLAIADHANDAGEAWPGMELLAAKCRITVRGAQQVVRRLEAAGWLVIAEGGGSHQTNRYWIDLWKLAGTLNGGAGFDGGDSVPEPCTAVRKPRTAVRETLNGGSPEPSITTKETITSSPARALLTSSGTPPSADAREELCSVTSSSFAVDVELVAEFTDCSNCDPYVFAEDKAKRDRLIQWALALGVIRVDPDGWMRFSDFRCEDVSAFHQGLPESEWERLAWVVATGQSRFVDAQEQQRRTT